MAKIGPNQTKLGMPYPQCTKRLEQEKLYRLPLEKVRFSYVNFRLI